MNDIAIRVENLGKQYRIAGRKQPYQTIREALAQAASAPFRRIASVARGNAAAENRGMFWALKDVSFEVKQGEVVGIIGRNGAGKSTLLKILSRITEPTTGQALLYGRVGSLLEVGTGFHPELTGRENIFLSGAIQGMRREEIKRKFDEIVAFAEVEQFVDTPVKHYSSGMYLRLAFAVAAHLEPEILLVDEVLAVGDAEFQQKCVNKMENAGSAGKAILFVSHNLNAIVRLCRETIWVDRGKIRMRGNSHEVVRQYLFGGVHAEAERTWGATEMPGDMFAGLLKIWVCGPTTSNPTYRNRINQPVEINVVFEVRQKCRINTMIQIFNEEAVLLFTATDLTDPDTRKDRLPGFYRTVFVIPPNYLAEGQHFVTVAVTDGTIKRKRFHCHAEQAVSFEIFDPMDGVSVRSGVTTTVWPGVVRPILTCKTERYNPECV